MEVLQNGRLVRFSKLTDVWCAFDCSVCDQTATSYVSRAAVPKVMTTYTDNGRTSSADTSCGRKPKLSERDRHTLQRIVYKNDRRTAAVKVTAELSIHPEDAVSTKTVQSSQSFTNSITTTKDENPVRLMTGN